MGIRAYLKALITQNPKNMKKLCSNWTPLNVQAQSKLRGGTGYDTGYDDGFDDGYNAGSAE